MKPLNILFNTPSSIVVAIFLTISCLPHKTLCSNLLKLDSVLPASSQLSKLGSIFEVETLNTFPNSKQENTYFLRIGPPIRFGDFSLTYSSSENKQDEYSAADVDRSSFNSWLVKRNNLEGPPSLYVPDNKPTGDAKIAFNGFLEYFPSQYLRPVLRDSISMFPIAKATENTFKGGIDTLFGAMNISLLGREELELTINGAQQLVRCIKILQEATFTSYNLDEGAAKDIIFTFKRTYWVLDNINDPLILKQEGYNSTLRHEEDYPNNGFKRIENSRIISINQ